MIPPLLPIFLWPVMVWSLFSKYRASAALLGAIIAGYLLLPTRAAFDLPMLPALSKNTAPAMAACLAVLMIKKLKEVEPTHLKGRMTNSKIANMLLIICLIAPLLTVLTNSDTLVYGPKALAGLRAYDGFSAILSMLLALMPLLLAYRYLAHPKHHRAFLIALMIAGLIYSVLALYETRMSPQINRMVYGFFPHSFGQHIRGDGYRPLVFLKHGLELSLFFAMSLLATIGCLRALGDKYRSKMIGAILYLSLILVMSKSLGALSIAIAFAPLVLMCAPRVQLLVAAIAAGCIISYPVLRGSGLIPIDSLSNFAASISAERAQSLQVRLDNEDALLEKAQQRPFLGWGGWGRGRIYNDRGDDISITDGYWIIILGNGGWVRYLGEFGLLAMPLILLGIRREKIGIETSTLAMILLLNLIDLIPNSGLTPVTWLIAGALWGRLGLNPDAATATAEVTVEENSRKLRYARPPKPVKAKPKKTRPEKRPPKSKQGDFVYRREHSAKQNKKKPRKYRRQTATHNR